MKLDNLVLVNWGQLRPGTYELGNMTMLTGPTGAGKSTMLDGLQTVMTAAYQGIVAYNPGQEEVQQGQRRGKSKRTLESFVVGAEYSRFSRPDGAQGYVAAVFRPDPDELLAKPFTALVAASARVDGVGERRDPKLERLVLVIVEDAALAADDFFDDVSDGVCVPVEEIIRRLKSKYPKVVSYDDHKRDYLCGLYGRFRGRSSIPWDEAQNAAKAWSQSIAYKPIGSVHDLVRDDILEFDGKALQESITRISDLMRQVTNLKGEGKRLEATVGRLRDLKQAIDQTSATFEDQVQLDLLLARMQLAADEERIALERQKIENDTALIKRQQLKAKTEAQQKQGVDNSRIEIAARLKGIPANTEKETLDKRLERATSDARAKLGELRVGLHAAAHMKNAADQIVARPVSEEFPRLRASVSAVAEAVSSTNVDRLAGLLEAVTSANSDAALSVEKLFQLSSVFDGIDAGLSELRAALVGPDDSVSTSVAAEMVSLAQRTESARKERSDLAERKQRLAAGAGNYNRDTVIALERIRERMPEAGVQVLCDLVEPASDEWQAAIEGYMDGSRFNLIVKPEFEALVIDYLKSFGSRSKVVQGKRCMDRADPSRIPGNSIIHELRTENPIAKAYLIEQFGTVVKVADSNELRTTPRGVTKDGKGSGSTTMFVCERKDFVLGREARERALQHTSGMLDQVDREIAALQESQGVLTDFRKFLANQKEPAFDAAPLAQYAGELEVTRRLLSQLDLTEVEELRKELERLEAQIDTHEAEIGKANKAVALAENRITEAGQVIDRINGGRDARYQEWQNQIHRLKVLCEVNPEKTYTVMAAKVEDLLASRSYDVTSLQAKLAGLRAQPERLLGDVRELLAEYNSAVRQDERFHSPLPHLPAGAKVKSGVWAA